jgi:hypothetical protein
MEVVVKKIKSFTMLVVLSMFFCSQADASRDVMSKARRISRSALMELRGVGLTHETVEEFKQRIQPLVKMLSAKSDEDDTGRVDTQIAVQQDLMILVDDLLAYQNIPDEMEVEKLCKAQKLRESAISNSSITEFVKCIMNRQVEQKYRFLPHVQE